VDLAQATENAEGVGDRLARRQTPALDADHLAPRRVDRGEHDVGALIEELEHPWQVGEIGGRVGLESDDRIIVGGLLQGRANAGVDRGAEAAIGVVLDDRQVHVAGVLADHFGGAVGGAVVDDDHAGAELARHRRQVGKQLGNVFRLVIGGDDEADHTSTSSGRGAGMSSSSTGRRTAADSRIARAAASALTPS
jgi:hypothetical protein